MPEIPDIHPVGPVWPSRDEERPAGQQPRERRRESEDDSPSPDADQGKASEKRRPKQGLIDDYA